MASLFSKPKTPKVEAPKPLPDPDDQQIQRARRRRIATEARGAPEASVLSGGGRETLGG